MYLMEGTSGNNDGTTGEAYMTVYDFEGRIVQSRTKVRAVSDLKALTLSLIHIFVAFHAGDRTVTLSPGQKISYNPANRKLRLREGNVDAELDAQLRSFQYVRLSKVAESCLLYTSRCV